jgi:hypothetical protein
VTFLVPDTEPDQAEWLRDVLFNELLARQPTLRRHFDYYEGDHPLPRAPKAARDAYRRLLAQSRTNWIQLVIDSVAERLQVVGFRFGDQGGDEDAWLIWQANGMDADAELAQTDALICGVNYVSVWPDESSPVGVRIAPEHPYQTIVMHDPANRRTTLASLKVWPDIDGTYHCWLATPETSYEWMTDNPLLTFGTTDVPPDVPPGSWQEVDVNNNPLGAVPVVELQPWPRTEPLEAGQVPGRSEVDGIISIQDRINTTILNRMIATEYAAFRQKWVTGLTLPSMRDPVTGEPITDGQGNEVLQSPFEIAVDRLLVAEDETVRFGEFGESDLAGYIRSVAADVTHLAAITKTPPHYLLGEIVNASGDALKAAETGLVSKVRRRSQHIGEAWEDVMRLAFGAIGDARAVDVAAEVIWMDFETRSESQRVDALLKMGTLGVPQEVLWQRWGASPQEVIRWRQMQAAEAMLTALAAPIPPPPPLPPPVIPSGTPGPA